MFIRLRRSLIALFFVCATAAWLHAAVPTFWQVSTEPDFMRGDFENLTVDAYGRLRLGPTASVVYEATAPFLWTVIAGPDGTVYAGSGDEGQVYRIDSAGRSALFFDADQLTVNALALAPGGALYVGTSPDGRIYRVEPDGTHAVFFDPGERYIWSLAVDQAGNVFAGTGDSGVIYRITPEGQGEPFYRTRATHAMSLAFDGEGRLLAGTESPGRVFRIDTSGRPFVLLESGYAEIHRLRVDDRGVIYAAAVGMGSGAGAREPARPATTTEPAPAVSSGGGSVTVTTEVTAVTPADGSSGATGPAQTGTGARGAGAVFRIQPDGIWDLLWESREDTPYDISFEPDGSLLVATGNRGKLFRLTGDPHQATMIARADAQQITSLLSQPEGQLLFATANPGKVYRLSAARAERGTYTSDVRDAQTVAAWGVIRWAGQAPPGTRIEIATRAGNTRTPDETWSDWSPAYAVADGSAIVSPRARYLQWRAVLTGSRGESPVLHSVTAAYLPRNIRPRVTSITVHPPGTVFQRPIPAEPDIAGFDGELPERRLAGQTPASGAAPALGRRVYQKGLLTVVWRAEDDNRDDLIYDVLYRREGEDSWKTLRTGLTEPILVWDTTSVPNGRYVIHVIASDAPSNTPESALTGALDSSTFEIDNAPPVITVTSVRTEGTRTIIAFEVRDEHSPVLKAEYSLDGDRWQVIHPKDGIADSRFEEFELVLDDGLGARGVILRATDALNNVATTRGDVVPGGAGSR
jgi:outer membrane protein assembly factor BamB